jgi:hypothetical protein
MEFTIHSKAEYDAAMKAIAEMMSRGEENLSVQERSAFFRMAVAVERFEDQFLNAEVYAPGLSSSYKYKISKLHG